MTDESLDLSSVLHENWVFDQETSLLETRQDDFATKKQDNVEQSVGNDQTIDPRESEDRRVFVTPDYSTLESVGKNLCSLDEFDSDGHNATKSFTNMTKLEKSLINRNIVTSRYSYQEPLYQQNLDQNQNNLLVSNYSDNNDQNYIRQFGNSKLTKTTKDSTYITPQSEELKSSVIEHLPKNGTPSIKRTWKKRNASRRLKFDSPIDFPKNLLESENGEANTESDEDDDEDEEEDDVYFEDVVETAATSSKLKNGERETLTGKKKKNIADGDERIDYEMMKRDTDEMGGVVNRSNGGTTTTTTTTKIAADAISLAANEAAAVGKMSLNGRKSQLEELLQQPIRRPPQYGITTNKQDYPTSTYFPLPNSARKMQFYQPPPAQHHHVRATPPPGFAQTPYGMRPHEEETRQIMNLDNQQAHNSSPTSSWNSPHQYAQMSNLNAYRGPMYPPPPPLAHGGVPPTNPYYHHPHMAPPQSAMIPQPPQQQQQAAQQHQYYGQAYGTNPAIPAPSTNGTGPVFSFNKPRQQNSDGQVGGAGGGGGGSSMNGVAAGSTGSSINNTNGGGGGSTNGNHAHRRKKHPDISSPRFGEELDPSVFPDMTDFPLLDVVQSKAKKDAGRKPCRPHLCEQSRMLISRVCHFHREFSKRLTARHPLGNSPLSKPDQWTSQIMGISLATVRKCMDMATEEEVFTRCTDKNLVNLTPSERAEREEMLAKLSTVFEDEKSLGAGTAGLTIAEYSPRRSYSNGIGRQPSTGENVGGTSTGGGGGGYMMDSGETTLLNLDDHSNSSSKSVITPTPTMDAYINGGDGQREMGQMLMDVGTGGGTSIAADAKDTPKIRGRPKKVATAASTVAAGGTGENTSPTGDGQIEEEEEEENNKKEEEIEKKTEDENETTTPVTVKQEALNENGIDREDDAASSEGTNRSETATPEPAAKNARKAKKRRGTPKGDNDEAYRTKKGRNGSASVEDDGVEHKMVTRARSRQP